MSSFKVGEIALLRLDPQTTPPELYQRYPAQDCQVLELEDWIWFQNKETGKRERFWVYLVRMGDGQELYAEAHELIKKQKPKREMDTVVAWKDCAWQPKINEPLEA